MKTRLAHWRLMVALKLRSRPVWLLSFAASLGIVGAFFLPWLRLEGTPDSLNGAELLALTLSPSVNYLAEVSEIQLWLLIGCPAVAIVAAVIVVWQYGQRKTALFATSCVLAAALVAMYAPSYLVSNEPRAYLGLSAVAYLSGALLLLQIAIKACTRRW